MERKVLAAYMFTLYKFKVARNFIRSVFYLLETLRPWNGLLRDYLIHLTYRLCYAIPSGLDLVVTLIALSILLFIILDVPFAQNMGGILPHSRILLKFPSHPKSPTTIFVPFPIFLFSPPPPFSSKLPQ